jgi:hypothetical protein
MSFEFPAELGTLRLFKTGDRWTLEFKDSFRGGWTSPDDAATAAASQMTGLPDWDCTLSPAPDDLLNWRPIGDNI